jgi:chromosome segregation ATPase
VSPTPRTDALARELERIKASDWKIDLLAHAQDLERELIEATAKISDLRTERDEWKHAFEVANTKDHEAIAADRALHSAIGRMEVRKQDIEDGTPAARLIDEALIGTHRTVTPTCEHKWVTDGINPTECCRCGVRSGSAEAIFGTPPMGNHLKGQQ